MRARKMDGDDVCLSVDDIFFHPFDVVLDTEVDVGRQIVGKNAWSETREMANDALANAADTKDSHSQPLQAAPHEAVPHTAAEPAVGMRNKSQERQDDANCELRDRWRRSVGRVGDENVSLSGGEKVNAVQTDSHTGDEAQVWCTIHDGLRYPLCSRN